MKIRHRFYLLGVADGSFPMDMGHLTQYGNPTVTTLVFKMDSDFRFDSEVRAVVKSVVKAYVVKR